MDHCSGHQESKKTDIMIKIRLRRMNNTNQGLKNLCVTHWFSVYLCEIFFINYAEYHRGNTEVHREINQQTDDFLLLA